MGSWLVGGGGENTEPLLFGELLLLEGSELVVLDTYKYTHTLSYYSIHANLTLIGLTHVVCSHSGDEGQATLLFTYFRAEFKIR